MAGLLSLPIEILRQILAHVVGKEDADGRSNPIDLLELTDRGYHDILEPHDKETLLRPLNANRQLRCLAEEVFWEINLFLAYIVSHDGDPDPQRRRRRLQDDPASRTKVRRLLLQVLYDPAAYRHERVWSPEKIGQETTALLHQLQVQYINLQTLEVDLYFGPEPWVARLPADHPQKAIEIVASRLLLTKFVEAVQQIRTSHLKSKVLAFTQGGRQYLPHRISGDNRGLDEVVNDLLFMPCSYVQYQDPRRAF